MGSKKTYLNWGDFYFLVGELESKIRKANKAYSHIYGIPRGGCNVAQAFEDSYCKITDFPLDKDMLVVDDIVDSGRTISKYKDWDTASIFYKPTSKVKPTYYAEKTNDWIVFPWEKEEDETIEDNIVRIIEAIGDNPNREGLLRTPYRVKKAYEELFRGYKMNLGDITTTFSNKYDQMVVLKDIEFYSFCEHHILPFFGKISIGYIPNGKVLGISKLARVVEMYSRRLQIQEQLGEDISKAIEDMLNTKGVAVYIEAVHFCMRARGVAKQNSVMVTSKLTGVFLKEIDTRNEFYKLIK